MPETKRYCSFRVGPELYGVEVERVQEVIRPLEMTRVPLAPPAVRGLINLRGQILIAIDLRRRLGLEDRQDGRLPLNVVIGTEDGPVSFLVDEIGSVIEVEETTFEEPPGALRGPCRGLIRGIHKLEEELLIVLDGEAAAAIDGGDLPGTEGEE